MLIEQLDALRRPLLEAGDADLGGRHELAVDRDRAVAVDEIADRAAVAGEVADAAADLLELRDRRRLGRGGLSARLAKHREPRESEGGDRERRSGDELTTADGHGTLLGSGSHARLDPER